MGVLLDSGRLSFRESSGDSRTRRGDPSNFESLCEMEVDRTEGREVGGMREGES